MSSRIAWTDHTINPGIYGCSPAGEGCWNCYAARMAHRLYMMGQDAYRGAAENTDRAKWTGRVRVDLNAIAPAFAKLPKRKPARVFVTSMGDLFHPAVPIAFQREVILQMAIRRHITFQVLTKRPWNVNAAFEVYRDKYSATSVASNIWIGCSCSTQAEVDRIVPELLRVPAAVRFVSLEPLLETVTLTHIKAALYNDLDALRCGSWLKGLGFVNHSDVSPGISWVIVGCESRGSRLGRECDHQWIRSVVEQCKAASVACFVKQIPGRSVVRGEEALFLSRDPADWPADLRVQEFPGGEDG